jgi:hypothetical protein
VSSHKISMKMACIPLFTALFLLSASLLCRAATYEWVDEKGSVNFSEDYTSIPERYRSGARERTEDDAGPSKGNKGSEQKRTAGARKRAQDKGEVKVSGQPKVNRNRCEADAADSLRRIVAFWKDEKYEALYECGTHAKKAEISKEKFIRGMTKKKWVLALSWEAIRDVEATFKSPTLVYVTARIGHRSKRGGEVKTVTETYPMKLEHGAWKADLSKFLKNP